MSTRIGSGMRARAILDFPQKVKFKRRAEDQFILSCWRMRSGKRGAGRFLNSNHIGTGREGGPSFRRSDASKSPNQGPRAQVRAERGARLGARLETELGTLRNEGSTKLK